MSSLYNFVNTNNTEIRYNIFNFSFIALASNLANIDSEINEVEIAYIFKLLPSLDKDYLQELINLSAEENQRVKFYTEKILFYFPNNNSLHIDLINSLINIAIIDQPLNIKEEKWLVEITALLKIEYYQFKKILSDRLFNDSLSASKLFNPDKKFTSSELNQAYKEVIKTCHPDSFDHYNNIANSYKEIMSEKFIIANEIYNLIKKRGI